MHGQQDPLPPAAAVEGVSHLLLQLLLHVLQCGCAKCAPSNHFMSFLNPHLVVGGAPPPEVVIVHGRQVVVDEAHGVDHLHGTRSGHGLLQVAWQQQQQQWTSQLKKQFETSKERQAAL